MINLHSFYATHSANQKDLADCRADRVRELENELALTQIKLEQADRDYANLEEESRQDFDSLMLAEAKIRRLEEAFKLLSAALGG